MQNTSIKHEPQRAKASEIYANQNPEIPPSSPIQQEFEELRDAIETLEKEHYNLADKLQPVIAIDHSESKKLEGAATEPQTGCLVKDKLADLKQRVLYIRRMTVDLKDRIWL